MDTRGQATRTSRSGSLTSSRRSSGRTTPMSIDLSDLPPLITPSPPSNTLLITNLDDIAIFKPDNLETIRGLINNHALIHTWAPLKSMRRIIVVFYDTESATLIRQTLDGEVIFDSRTRVYFGAQTDIEPKDQHLEAPKSQKLFFISPPPSPPQGWQMRDEEPPNKEVHADDLTQALSKLNAWKKNPIDSSEDSRMEDDDDVTHRRSEITTAPPPTTNVQVGGGRNRSASILVYHPDHNGDSPDLPAIAVEDLTQTTYSMDEDPYEPAPSVITHTMRPPIELM